MVRRRNFLVFLTVCLLSAQVHVQAFGGIFSCVKPYVVQSIFLTTAIVCIKSFIVSIVNPADVPELPVNSCVKLLIARASLIAAGIASLGVVVKIKDSHQGCFNSIGTLL